jgi:FMN phosphatase YigB (HAD superfamily)/SAM-dependent methyltransferase
VLKAVLFDLGDTLVDVSTWKKKFPRAIVNFLVSKYDVPKNIAKEKLLTALKEVEEISKVKEIDKIDEASKIYSSLLKEAGYNVREEEISNFTVEFRDKHLKLLPHAKQALKLLKKKGYTLYVVSNAKKDRLKRFLEISNIGQFFTKSFISGEAGTTKKERLFEVFLNSTGLSPKECLMVGNDPESDGNALSYGIPVCLISKDEKVENYTFKISSLKGLKKVIEFFNENPMLNCKICGKKVRNKIICKDCKKKLEKDIENDAYAISLISELAEFTNSKFEDTFEKILNGPLIVREEWIEKWPTTEEEVNKFYKENTSYVYDLSLVYLHKNWRDQNKEIVSYVVKNNFSTAMDFGSGIGQLALELSEAGIDVSCVDVSEYLLKYLRFRADKRGKKIKLYKEIPNEKFDIVIATDVLEHLWKPEEVLNKLCSHANKAIAITFRPFRMEDVLHPMHLQRNAEKKKIFDSILSSNGFFLEASGLPRGLEIWRKKE